MARGSWTYIFLVLAAFATALSLLTTGIGLTFVGWPIIIGILWLLFVIAAAFGK